MTNPEKSKDNDNLDFQINNDLKVGLYKLEIYEKSYMGIKENGMEYLREYAKKYRKEIEEIQNLILPKVRKVCSICTDHCCKIYSRKHRVYTAGSLGGFSFKDYLFARFNSPFPEIDFENIKNKICPFWDNGCKFSPEKRSLVCISWFCDDLKKEIDTDKVEYHLKKAEKILRDFSIEKCLGF